MIADFKRNRAIPVRSVEVAGKDAGGVTIDGENLGTTGEMHVRQGLAIITCLQMTIGRGNFPLAFLPRLTS
jgi:hypothetical protein